MVSTSKGRNIRFIYTLFLTCLGLVMVSIFYANSHVGSLQHATTQSSSSDDQPLNRNLLIARRQQRRANNKKRTSTKKKSTNHHQQQPFKRKKSNRKVTDSSSSGSSKSSDPSEISSCGNSERWLTSPRHGNFRDDIYLTDSLVQHMILNLTNVLLLDQPDSSSSSISHVLGQTICHAKSRFLNTTLPTSSDDVDDKTLRMWTVKLIYLALHYHQHRHATNEAMARYNGRGRDSSQQQQCPTPNMLQQEYNVGKFDYECPNAKYIVMPLGGNGLGANVRGGMVVAMLMGLMSDRIVLFVNNAKKGTAKFLQRPWSLASCDRLDYQCFFWATSPCTLTNDDLKHAYPLKHAEYLRISKRQGQLKSIQHHKVWTFSSSMTPVTGLPRRAAERLYEHATTLINAVVSETENRNPHYVALLRRAAETILETDPPRDGYNYAAASMKVHHTLSFYAMRPNPRYAHELNVISNKIIPPTFQPENAIGLPIRASDKCEYESECLSFDQHMQVSSDMWQRHQKSHSSKKQKKKINKNPTVVFTTEATSVVAEQKAFVASHGDQQRFPFKFDFVTNSHDITPDSGFMKDVVSNSTGQNTADEIMLSAMSSLQAQLLPRISIGNCCSNFHVLLNDLLSEGCGAASDNTFLCLQEYDDPALRVCCGWHRQCQHEKADYIRNMTARTQQQ